MLLVALALPALAALGLGLRGRLAGALALMAPDVEFTPYERALEGLGPYRGHDGVRTWWHDSFAAFPDLSVEAYEVRDLGHLAFVHGRLRGQGAGSGAPFERTLWQALEWRDRKTVWWRAFASEADALKAAGLSE